MVIDTHVFFVKLFNLLKSSEVEQEDAYHGSVVQKLEGLKLVYYILPCLKCQGP